MPPCGGMLNASADGLQYFTSPLYPENYPSRRTCTWLIVAPPGHRIMLEFVDFHTHQINQYHCHDPVIVYNGSISNRISLVGQ